MSLIQDALKRKSEEKTGNLPPEIPVEILERPEDKNNTRSPFIIVTVLLVAGLIAVLAGIGIYLIKPEALPPVIQKPVAVAPAPVPPAAVPEPVAVQEALIIPAVKTTAVETVTAEIIAEPAKKEAPVTELKETWPELKLTGIAQSDNQSIAVINGKMLSAGRTLGKVIVREVTGTDVVVEYHGERRVLHIDE